MTDLIKSPNAELLNRLDQMQQAPYYATARNTLAQAEAVIVRLEQEQNVAQQACRRIVNIIECVENRCMAADGPVTPTTKEITEDDLRRIWLAAKEGAGL